MTIHDCRSACKPTKGESLTDGDIDVLTTNRQAGAVVGNSSTGSTKDKAENDNNCSSSIQQAPHDQLVKPPTLPKSPTLPNLHNLPYLPTLSNKRVYVSYATTFLAYLA